MLHQYEWRDFGFRDRITPLRYKFILEVKVSFLKCRECAHVAASRKRDFIYSSASAASLAWYLANCQLLLPYLFFSYPCSHELGFDSREILDVTIIREYLMGMVICISFSLDILLIFCLSNTMPSLNLNALYGSCALSEMNYHKKNQSYFRSWTWEREI